MSNPAILIVEDEPKISRILQLELEEENYKTSLADNGEKALDMIENNEWDLVLLDIMLPGLSGMEVLRKVRRTDSNTPIILLTARDEVYDKVSGLDLGANDYITKPFQIEELLARVRANLRKKKRLTRDDKKITHDDLSVDLNSRDVIRAQTSIHLTPREFDLLVCLLKNKNIVLTRDQLLDQVWGYEYFGDTNIVDVYIRYLRQKIDKDFETAYIQTVRGVGYTIKD